MTPLPYSRDYWLQRAEEARTRANEMIFPHTRELVLRAAKSYERLAKTASDEPTLILHAHSRHKDRR